MATEWTKLVQKIYNENKDKKGGYKLGDAMKDAKKVYKKGGNDKSEKNKSKKNKSKKNKSEKSKK
jgi:hypothetical protein